MRAMVLIWEMTVSLKGGSVFSVWAREATRIVNSNPAISKIANRRLANRDVINVVPREASHSESSLSVWSPVPVKTGESSQNSSHSSFSLCILCRRRRHTFYGGIGSANRSFYGESLPIGFDVSSITNPLHRMNSLP